MRHGYTSLSLVSPVVTTSSPLGRSSGTAVLRTGLGTVDLPDLPPEVGPKQHGLQKWEGDFKDLSSVSMHWAPCQQTRETETGKRMESIPVRECEGKMRWEEYSTFLALVKAS